MYMYVHLAYAYNYKECICALGVCMWIYIDVCVYA